MLTKQFLIFLGIGLALVALVIAFTFVGTKSAHLELQGKVLKVRTMPADDSHTIVIVDFRVTNPSKVPFVVNSAEIQVDSPAAGTVTGEQIAKMDMDRYFEYNKLIGPKYNPMLSIPDHVPPYDTMDRMVAGVVNLSASQVDGRKALRVRLTDIDGLVQDIQ